MIPPFLMLSEALRAAQICPLRAGWVFPHPARIDRRRATQSGAERLRATRGGARLAEALRGPQIAPFHTGTGKQSHQQRNRQHRPTQRPTEALRAQRGTTASTEAHGERRSGATDPSVSEALRSGSERVRQRLHGGNPSGRCCPRFWTVYGPVIHSRQLDASNRSS